MTKQYNRKQKAYLVRYSNTYRLDHQEEECKGMREERYELLWIPNRFIAYTRSTDRNRYVGSYEPGEIKSGIIKKDFPIVNRALEVLVELNRIIERSRKIEVAETKKRGLICEYIKDHYKNKKIADINRIYVSKEELAELSEGNTQTRKYWEGKTPLEFIIESKVKRIPSRGSVYNDYPGLRNIRPHFISMMERPLSLSEEL